jgi:MoaD family protein
MPIVKLYANLRKVAGTKELFVAGADVGSVLSGLVRLHPPLEEKILEDEGLRPHIVVTVNGHHVTDMKVSLAEEDVVAIFPPIAGG